MTISIRATKNINLLSGTKVTKGTKIMNTKSKRLIAETMTVVMVVFGFAVLVTK